MLLWLSGTENTKWSPNENYARELMELFTLGAGRGYTERDVREQARALTGFDNDWKRGAGNVNFRYDRERHDAGSKRIFGKSGAFDWQDAVRLCLHHPKHAPFFVDKLWHYFIPVAPDAGTRRSLEAMYRKDYDIRPDRRRDPPPPGALHRPADGEAAGRLHRRPPARDRPRHRHHLVGVARLGDRPAPLHAAERRRLGRRALARHRHVPRALVGRELRDASRTRSPTSRRPSFPPSRRRSSKPRSSSGAPPRCVRPRAPRSFDLREPSDGRCERQVEADELPVPDRERASAS